MPLPTIEGWRSIEPQFPSRCDLCGEYIERRQTYIFYNQILKQWRHGKCHFDKQHEVDTLEVWTAEVQDENEDGDPVTVTRNIIISTIRRLSAHPREVRLLTHLATFPNDTPLKQIRAEYQTKGHYSA